MSRKGGYVGYGLVVGRVKGRTMEVVEGGL